MLWKRITTLETIYSSLLLLFLSHSEGTNGQSAFPKDRQYPLSFSEGAFVRDCVGREDERLLVLTFNDGPWTYSSPIMDILKEKEAPATFFVIVSNLQQNSGSNYEQILWRMLLEGHTIGNHGLSNDPFEASQVREAHEKIMNLTDGYVPRYFRPSQAIYTVGKVEQVLADLVDYKFVLWNLDTSDWKADRDPQDILDQVQKVVQDPLFAPPVNETANHGLPRRGSIMMLAHDNHDTMLDLVLNPTRLLPLQVPLLAAMIDVIRENGYRIVSMDECLGLEPQPIPSATRFCGAAFSEAAACPTALTCPLSTDEECPDGMRCFGSLTCAAATTPTTIPSMLGPTISPAPSTGPTSSPSHTETASSTISDQPTVTAASSFCGATFSEAVACPTALACPLGTNGECPNGMMCFGEITCNTPIPPPSAVPTRSPAPTRSTRSLSPTATASPTTIDQPVLAASSSFCGTEFSEAADCPAALSCPLGTNEECPNGMRCFGSITCAAPIPSSAGPTASPLPTLRAGGLGEEAAASVRSGLWSLSTSLLLSFAAWAVIL